MRRRIPWWVLALLFIVLPVVEIFVHEGANPARGRRCARRWTRAGCPLASWPTGR